MSITENVLAVKKSIADKCAQLGLEPGSVRLCAATKMNDAARVREAVEAGVDICGENRVQELTEKLGQGAYEGCPLHFIGHLQKNKVKYLVGRVSLIESVDCMELLEAINKKAAQLGVVQDILLEVNIGAEAAKSGFFARESDAEPAENGRISRREGARTDGDTPDLPRARRNSAIFLQHEAAFC